MRAKIQKWGNSLAVRIPKALAELVELSDGREVELSVVDGKMIVQPARKRRYTLDELVANTVSPRRFALAIILGFAGLALLLAVAWFPSHRSIEGSEEAGGP